MPLGFRRALAAPGALALASQAHGVAMAAWCLLLLVQPLLLRGGRPELHRRLGRAARGLAVVVVTSMAVMVRKTAVESSSGGVERLAEVLLPATQLVLFAAYTLAAFRAAARGQWRRHGRSISIASLTLLGPTVGRFDLAAVGLAFDPVQASLVLMEAALGLGLLGALRHRGEAAPWLGALTAFGAAHLAVSSATTWGAWLLAAAP